MAIAVRSIDHVNVTVPRALESAARRFYGEVLGLAEIAKPGALHGRGGAWFQVGPVQLHLSIEEFDAAPSRRHVCFVVADLVAARVSLQAAAVEILPDDRPVPGWSRFYVCDPGGNRIEIAQPA